MSVAYFSYVKTEQKNSIKAFVGSISILLLLLILIYFLRFEIKPPEELDAPPYLSLVDFIPIERIKDYEDAGGSKGAPGLEELEGGSKGNAEQTPQPEPDPVADSKVETKPVETQTVPTSPPPVVTSSEPDVVKLPTPPPIKIPPKPAPDVVTAPSSPGKVNVPEPTKPSTTPSTSAGDDDQPGSGGTGTGSGSGTGSGDANSGSGTGAGGGTGTGGGGGTGGGSGAGTGSGTGDGVGVDFDETGPLRRQRDYCPNTKLLATPKPQKVAFNICINREGYVTYCRYNSRQSESKDIAFIKKALETMKDCRFKPNDKAPKKECGVVTFVSAGQNKPLN
ncbi:MAG: hypothetical protein IPQ10_14225 [Saprospiraceae bacterium]|nr:hypothetical protein [Saprospiraceae bacterium]MBK7794931.1 hypothetical protein [Saprospiraceae bacterium]MBL0262178.1 hypothetical protein [Saprospiraceae bacterium]MBX7163783.1 hypothetical protein [Saprospiraceae bacterium]